MRMLRVTWLIALTLVATTLPASAWAAPAKKAKTAAPVRVEHRTSSRKAPGKSDGKSNKVKIAPNTELWDGSSTRSTGKVSGPVPVEASLGQDAGRPITPCSVSSRDETRQSAIVTPCRTGWLIGHYAHAPPCAA